MKNAIFWNEEKRIIGRETRSKVKWEYGTDLRKIKKMRV